MINTIKRNLLNIPGWSSKRKIVVFESDDWGSIRMPSAATFTKLDSLGVDVSSGDSLRFNRFDTLESSNDLDALFSTLRRYRDASGRHPVFTALSLVANPDFGKISKDKFANYHFEPFQDTLEKYYPGQRVFETWKQGVSEKIFVPEFHGREHLNVNQWLKHLRQGDLHTTLAFNEGMWGFNNPPPVSYQAAFDFHDVVETVEHKLIIQSGLDLFRKTFGFGAAFFVPPNALMSENCHPVLKTSGIEYLFGTRMYPIPLGHQKFKRRILFTGMRNESGQTYIIRNAFFEPSQGDNACVEKCIQDIAMAFRWKKPAVISTHRVNFIGSLYEKNRVEGLEKLDQLLRIITTRWPDVEFMTSTELGRLITGQRK